MKRYASLLAAVMALFMMVCALPVAAQPSATVTVETVTAKPGDTVTLSVSISEVSDIGGMNLFMSYDSAVLECLDGQFAGFASGMSMASVNTQPLNRPSQIVATAIAVSGVDGSGEIVTLTFKVKDNAPAGLSVVGFTDDVQELIALPDYQAWDVLTVTGGVMVETDGSAAPAVTTTAADVDSDSTTQPAQQTNAQTDTDIPTAPTVVVVDEQGQTVTRADGEVVTLPTAATAIDINGAVVTDASGAPSMVQSVAVMVDEVGAKAGETVSVNVSLSAVADLTVLGINLGYDTDSLSFVSGEIVGFVKENMSMSNVQETEKGIVTISATDIEGVSGNGTVAVLTFKVNSHAKSKDCRLSFANEPILMSKDVPLPLQLFAGEIRVDGGDNDTASSGGMWIVLILIVVAVVVVFVVVLRRRRKTTEPTEQPCSVMPGIADVSSDDDPQE